MNFYEKLDAIIAGIFIVAIIGAGYIVYEMRDIIFGINYH